MRFDLIFNTPDGNGTGPCYWDPCSADQQAPTGPVDNPDDLDPTPADPGSSSGCDAGTGNAFMPGGGGGTPEPCPQVSQPAPAPAPEPSCWMKLEIRKVKAFAS